MFGRFSYSLFDLKTFRWIADDGRAENFRQIRNAHAIFVFSSRNAKNEDKMKPINKSKRLWTVKFFFYRCKWRIKNDNVSLFGRGNSAIAWWRAFVFTPPPSVGSAARTKSCQDVIGIKGSFNCDKNFLTQLANTLISSISRYKRKLNKTKQTKNRTTTFSPYQIRNTFSPNKPFQKFVYFWFRS